ncbi:PilX N-terminal domain-containing pilus assembly protein [Pseudomonas sp. NA-150]|uniref:pilus assembly PilX family protein n=1 Tax=Pseudomonas sp. NA-150 TaxID=3367525 RepID=UPI0037C5AB2A
MNTAQQRGMVLLTSLIFLLLLSLLSLSSMRNASLQEKIAGSVKLRNESFQLAEAALRIGESTLLHPDYALERCPGITTCAPPAEAVQLTTAGRHPTSGVTWVAVSGGFYGVQNFAQTLDPVNVMRQDEEPEPWTLYRITGIGIQGSSRTVLESVNVIGRRIMWRQIH